MTNSKTTKSNPQIISKLQSNDSQLIIETINQLRDSGNISYTPVLIEILHSSTNSEINSSIISLLNDIKDKDLIPIITDAIQDEKYSDIRKELVSVCWESSLDFTTSLPLFVDLLIKEELLVVFEAYTVITNMDGKISSEMLNTETDKMEAAMPKLDEQIRQLVTDVIDYLPGLNDQSI